MNPVTILRNTALLPALYKLCINCVLVTAFTDIGWIVLMSGERQRNHGDVLLESVEPAPDYFTANVAQNVGMPYS